MFENEKGKYHLDANCRVQDSETKSFVQTLSLKKKFTIRNLLLMGQKDLEICNEL